MGGDALRFSHRCSHKDYDCIITICKSGPIATQIGVWLRRLHTYHPNIKIMEVYMLHSFKKKPKRVFASGSAIILFHNRHLRKRGAKI